IKKDNVALSVLISKKKNTTIKKIKNISAPGPFRIGYRLIKQADLSSQEFFKQLANKCLLESDIPD
ncbi:31917_t:CDS:2, partial [Gigaspora margarita]